jgi:hypothetical protein
LRRLASTIAFCFAFVAVALGVAVVATLSPPATAAPDEAEARASKSAPIRVPYADRDSVSLTVRMESTTETDRARLQAEVHFLRDFGVKASGQIRLSKANGQEILAAPLASTSLIIYSRPSHQSKVPRSHSTEQTFMLQPTAIHIELLEGETVYADVVIRGEDGTEYDAGRLEARVTHLPVTYFP